jgi:hypothetical protein
MMQLHTKGEKRKHQNIWLYLMIVLMILTKKSRKKMAEYFNFGRK